LLTHAQQHHTGHAVPPSISRCTLRWIEYRRARPVSPRNRRVCARARSDRRPTLLALRPLIPNPRARHTLPTCAMCRTPRQTRSLRRETNLALNRRPPAAPAYCDAPIAPLRPLPSPPVSLVHLPFMVSTAAASLLPELCSVTVYPRRAGGSCTRDRRVLAVALWDA
jgi:hypothetical protein